MTMDVLELLVIVDFELLLASSCWICNVELRILTIKTVNIRTNNYEREKIRVAKMR